MFGPLTVTQGGVSLHFNRRYQINKFYLHFPLHIKARLYGIAMNFNAIIRHDRLENKLDYDFCQQTKW